MLGVLSAVTSIAGTLFGFATNKELREWVANASNVAFNIQVADFSKATLYFDDVHLHKVYSDTKGKVLSSTKIDDTNSLDVICRKVALKTVNNRFDLPDNKDHSTYSLVSYLIDQTLEYVKNIKTSPQDRLAYVTYVSNLLKHFSKDTNFKFDLTDADIKAIDEIARLNTKNLRLISSDRVRVIKLSRIEQSQQTKILDSDRFKRIFVALGSKDFETSSMPNVYSARDVIGVGGTPLDQYLSMIHKDTVNNKYEFGTLLSCLLDILNKFLTDSIPQNKAANATDIFQKLITIIIDKDIEVTDNDRRMLGEVNIKLAKYLGAGLVMNLDKTAGIDASIMVDNSAGVGSRVSQSNLASSDHGKQVGSVDEGSDMRIAGVPYSAPAVATVSSSASAAVSPQFAASASAATGQAANIAEGSRVDTDASVIADTTVTQQQKVNVWNNNKKGQQSK